MEGNLSERGAVYLIGAGPGDPGLITVRGRECLLAADVVIYDRLIDPELLNWTRPSAERIYVGKQPDRHTLSQDEINELLVQKAQAGLKVARLKGGDPFVFGRGGEEAQALAAAGLYFEVIPGITSAIAAPAYAGIPVTHREAAASFAVVTGHRRKGIEAEENPIGVDWAAIAGVDTLVFLMGVSTLPVIAQSLIDAGRDPQTPVAVIRWGTTPQQRVVAGCLADIADRAQQAGLPPPAVTVVGEVAALRAQLRWFDNRPLFGKRILVTRARSQASQLSARLRSMGAAPIEFPTIEIIPPNDWTPLEMAIERLAAYDWAIFTSVNGVQFFWQQLERTGKDSRAFAGCRLAAIGPTTAEALARRGLRADLVPAEYVAEAILAEIGSVAGKRVLLPRADIARPTLAEGLRSAGAVVDEIVAYQTVQGSGESAAHIRQQLLDGHIDVITLTTSSPVRNLVMSLAPFPPLPEHTTIACIGPVTADTARELGLPVQVVAAEHTIDGLVAALVSQFTNGEMDD